MARVLETDSNANLDISSAVAIGAYTADAARYVTTRVTVDQVSGSGDYLIYATVQDGGTGSAYRGIPITTATAAAGVTAILFVSSPIPMVSGDILTVYLDGLAGDTTNPDTKVIFFEQDYLRPTVAGRTLDVTATGEAGIDWSNIGAPTSTVALTDTTINTSTLESMIGSIGSGTGAAMNFAATGDNTGGAIHGATFVGAQAGGTTYANTAAEDIVYHQLTNTANVIDIVYNFSVGAGRTGTKATFKGYIVSSNDTFNVQAWDYVNNVWETRGYIVGQTGTTNVTKDFALLARNTGTGADAGEVHIRLITRAGASSPSLFVDELLVSASNLGQTVGYLEASVWINPSGVAGTTPFVNGTADNPVPTIAEAYTIAAATGLKGLNISPGTTVTLTQSASGWHFGGGGKVALGGQNIGYANFKDIYSVSGTSTGEDASFKDCGISDITIAHAYFDGCKMKGTFTMATSGDYIFAHCYDALPGAASSQTFVWKPYCDIVFRDWRGGITFEAMGATNVAFLDGAGRLTANASCSGGLVTLRGDFPPATGAGASNLTITQTQRWGTDQSLASITGSVGSVVSGGTIADAVWDEVLTGATHNIANSAARKLRQVSAAIVTDGSVVSGGVNWVQLDADASSTPGSYDPSIIVVTAADGTVQCRNIFQYGADKKAIVDRNWKVVPENTGTYVIYADAGREHVNEGLVRAATLNTVQLNANASTTDNAYRGQLIFLRSGVGEDQVRRVLSYNGTTQTATVLDWDITPDATSAYAMLPTGSLSYEEIEDAVWDATKAAHTASGSMGEAENKLDATISSRHASGAAVASVTGNVSGSVGSVLGGVTASVDAQDVADALNLVPVSGAVSGSVNYQLAAIRSHTDLLTSNATINVVAGSSGSEMSLVRGNTHSFTIGYTSSIGTPTEVWLGIKKSALYELDSEAELLVSSLSDLVYLARATPASGLVSGATFEYTAGVGFNFTCTAEVAALLTPGTYEYGIQWVSGGSVNEGITGTCTISADIVRET